MADSEQRVSRSTAIFAGGTLFSRVLGLIRDMLWSRLVPTPALDAFIIAFRLPNMLRDIVGEGAMNAAFVPVFSHCREREGEASFRSLIASAMGAMLLLLLALTFLGVILVPALLQLVYTFGAIAGEDPPSHETIGLVVSLARLTFPYLFFIGMAVFAMGPLFTMGHYITPSWSPALLNVSIIGCILVFHYALPDVFPNMGYALVLGVWLGGIAQLAALYIALGHKSGVWKPDFRITHPGVREVMILMVPVIIGQAPGEANKLVDSFFAYSLETGTVIQLFNANRLVQLPLSMFGFATAAAVLPAVSAAAGRGDADGIRVTLMQGIRQTYFLIFPAALGLIVLGKPIVRLLFEGGAFIPEYTERTAIALAIYAVGLLSFALVKVAVTGFYGIKDTKTPVVVAGLSMLLNIALNFLLVRPLGYQGLALATTISYTVNFIALYALLSDKFGTLWDQDLGTALVRIMLASAMVVAVAYGIYVRLLAAWGVDTIAGRLGCVAIPILVAGPLYLALGMLLRMKEAEFLRTILIRRFRGTR